MSAAKSAKFDSNVWYHVTEGRADNYDGKKFQSMLQISKSGPLVVLPAKNLNHYWQFIPVDGIAGYYAVRCYVEGINKQLGTCYNQSELNEQHTQPCLLNSDGSDTQKWNITEWADDEKTYRFQNVQNGTGLNMDVHPGNPMFMSNDQNPKNHQSAQHWLMTSVRNINDAAYSTTFTEVPVSVTKTISTTFPSSTNPSGSKNGKHSGLSSGAAAGIGVGVTLAVILLSVAAFFFWRRRRRAATGSTKLQDEPVSSDMGKSPTPGYSKYEPVRTGPEAHEMYHNPIPQEVSGEGIQPPQELDATPIHGSPGR